MKSLNYHLVICQLTAFVKPTFYFLFLFLFIHSSHAQECGTDAIHELKMTNDVEYQKKYIEIENLIYERTLSGNFPENAIYTLPLVFHIIHLGEDIGVGSNIPDYKIYQALDNVNAQFANQNGVGVDTDIQFCIASVDPDGNPTNGINRVDGSGVENYATIGDYYLNRNALKDLTKWNSTDYLNVYIVHQIQGLIGGYASVPAVGTYSGVTIKEISLVGNLVFSHELGHALGLHHTFKGSFSNVCAPNDNCYLDGDRVCDTPPHLQAECDENICSNEPNYENSTNNYMSYCAAENFLFTQGQKDRMLTTIDEYLVFANTACPSINDNVVALNFYGDVCANQFYPNLKFRNQGTNTLTSFNVEFQVPGLPLQTQVVNTNVEFGKNGLVILDPINITSGINDINITLTLPNGNIDLISEDNSATTSASNFSIIPDHVEDFENLTNQLPDGWVSYVTSDGIRMPSQWQLDQTPSGNKDISARPALGRLLNPIEKLTLPTYDLNGKTNLVFSFDYMFLLHAIALYHDISNTNFSVVAQDCASGVVQTLWERSGVDIVTSFTIDNEYYKNIQIDMNAYQDKMVSISFVISSETVLTNSFTTITRLDNINMKSDIILPAPNDCSDPLSGLSLLGEFEDHKYYISDFTDNWMGAKSIAEDYGGYLASISTQEENDFIHALVSSIGETVFIGFNDWDSEGTYAWVSDETFNYSNFTETNTDTGDFGRMNSWNGEWGLDNLFVNRKFIVEKSCSAISNGISLNCPADLAFTTDPNSGLVAINFSDPTGTTDCPNGGLNILNTGIIGSGTALGVGTYTIPYEATDACGNVASCSFEINVLDGNIGGCPTSIAGFTYLGEFNNSKYFLSDSNSQPAEAQSFALQNGGYLVSINSESENNFIQQNISELVYIGLNDVATEGNLEWSNGDSFSYNNINPCSFCNENSDDYDYVIIAPWDGGWSFSNLWNQRKYIMEIPCNNSPSDISLSCLPSSIQFSTDSNTGLAEISLIPPTGSTTCASGGLSIENISPYNSGDQLEVGTYLVTYEATDACGNLETCMVDMLIVEDPNGGCDSPLQNFTSLGEYNGSSYYLSDDAARPTDAQLNAENLGGHLATIQTQGENDFIADQVSVMTYIGLNDENTEASLSWFNGEIINYSNFDICNFCNENSDQMDYVIMHGWNGAWSWSNFYNQRKYIVEIPCSSGASNNTNTLITFQSKENVKPMLEELVPNPAGNFIFLKINSPEETAGEIHIYDAQGILVKNQFVNFYQGIHAIEVDISEFAGGMFFVKIPMAKNGFSMKKFIKVRD